MGAGPDDKFDPYHKWLAIPPRDQPPHHYRLLGVEVFEPDADVIERAADRQMAYVRTLQHGEHADLSEKILNELAVARACLLDAKRRQQYDQQLRLRHDGPITGKKVVELPMPSLEAAPPRDSRADLPLELDIPAAPFAERPLTSPFTGNTTAPLGTEQLPTPRRVAPAQVQLEKELSVRRALARDKAPASPHDSSERYEDIHEIIEAAGSSSPLAGGTPPTHEVSAEEIRAADSRSWSQAIVGRVAHHITALFSRLSQWAVATRLFLLAAPGRVAQWSLRTYNNLLLAAVGRENQILLNFLHIVIPVVLLLACAGLVYVVRGVALRAIADEHRNLREDEHATRGDDAYPRNGSRDYDLLATGTWIDVPITEQRLARLPGAALISPGVLELNNCSLTFDEFRARDGIIRAQVKKFDGLNLGLVLRDKGTHGQLDYSGYSAFFNGKYNGQGYFGIGKMPGDGTYVDLSAGMYAVASPDFFEFAVASVGDQLSLYIDGKQIISVRDASSPEGGWGVGTTGGRSQFKNIQVQILKPAGIVSVNAPQATLATPVEPVRLPSITNRLGMKLVLIPAGEFLMGSRDSDSDASSDEKPQHRVKITKPFYLGCTEVTQAQYESIMSNNPSHFIGDANRPVEKVSWNDATEFCRRLSEKEGLTYRLPTEAEWEYACRAGSTTRWSFGDHESDLAEYAWYSANANGTTHPVGQKKPNAWGLHEMHGNVYEWCSDCYGAYTSQEAVNPTGQSDGTTRVLRGGAWLNGAKYARSACRLSLMPVERSGGVGFRVARTYAAEATAETTTQPAPTVTLPSAPQLAKSPFGAKQAMRYQQAWAKHLSAEVQISNSVGMQLVLIPPGEFLMGSPDSDPDAQPSEKPQHRVKITRAFYLGSSEVTQAQYKKVMGRNPSHFTGDATGERSRTRALGQLRLNPSHFTLAAADPPKANPSNFSAFANRPVESVTWNEAIDFCRRLSETEGVTYRLPTEAEWEYACRSGGTTEWSFGDDESDLTKYAWFNANANATTQPVGQKIPNAWRLYDMHGNVLEWCSDWSGEYMWEDASDPTGPADGTSRVLRGGSWNGSAENTRSAYRVKFTPVNRMNFLSGFRVARTYAAEVTVETSTQPAPTVTLPSPPPLATAPFDSKQAMLHQQAWAKHLALEEEITNSIGMQLVLIPPGEFLMGSPDSDPDAQPSEKPQHRVNITRPFYLATTEVTQAQYTKVMGGNPSRFKTRPVEEVTWYAATEFCRRLSKTEGVTYRLPTEAEWEYACRAGSTTRWSFGHDASGLAEYAWFSANANNTTHLVGQKKPNAWGLYDMHGNMWEWCSDCLGSYSSEEAVNPRGPVDGTSRVLRGGSWLSNAWISRSAGRYVDAPDDLRDNFGFRVTRTP